jgi:hypothetical protein
MIYEFKGINADRFSVEADNEQEARHKAMLDRWGPPTGIYSHPYKGRGLEWVNAPKDKK